MIFVYNFLQIILLIIFFPFLILLVLGRKKYRGRTLQKLGLRLPDTITGKHDPGGSRIWIHCLSVGEVTSAIPLIKGVRARIPNGYIAVSVSTTSGMKVARAKIADHVDLLLFSPFDFLPSVNRVINFINPALFILVETDFWPNWLDRLKRFHIPTMLVNGRISESSYRKYQRFRFFFTPMFRSFSFLSMQTEADARQIQKLGIPQDRLCILGNLKFEAVVTPDCDGDLTPTRQKLNLPETGAIWICGSTHPGEEDTLLSAFTDLQVEHPDLILILAPRDPVRGQEIAASAAQKGLAATLRSADTTQPTPVLILDTLGELTECYHLARIAFIGGSLASCGGHNPLEASIHGVPTFFGPHMEDFQEIARDLMHCGGGKSVATSREIKELVSTVLLDDTVHKKMSSAALDLVDRNRGVIRHHVDFIFKLLKNR